VLALVRGLVEWVPTSAAWAGYVAGPLVVLGYLAGSIPLADRVAVRQFRRQLARDRPVARSLGDIDPATVITGVLTGAITLLVATVAWDVGQEAAPPGLFSAVGTYSVQALGAWASLALWTGTAAMVGSMLPVWTGFKRGGSGVGPALALLVAFMPLLATSALALGSLTYVVTQRYRLALAAAVAAVVVTEWVAWVTDLQTLWGLTNGPELGLWSAVVAVVLLGRSASTPGQ
jgi:glycerol-3-phosphate acyltransferase PlsY